MDILIHEEPGSHWIARIEGDDIAKPGRGVEGPRSALANLVWENPDRFGIRIIVKRLPPQQVITSEDEERDFWRRNG